MIKINVKWFLMFLMIAALMKPVSAQKLDEDRMTRDIAVAENVLGTLIKQQVSNNQRNFFPIEIQGNYQQGYGVTFSLPADFTTPMVFMYQGASDMNWGPNPYNQNSAVTVGSGDNRENSIEDENDEPVTGSKNAIRLNAKGARVKNLNMDSVRDAYNAKVVAASKTFLADYGDLISQVAPQERVIVSNQANQRGPSQFFSGPKRVHLSVEAIKSDLTQFREGKMTRQQLMSKIKVVNTESVEEVEPDLELLSSILTRLYGQDISKTYFVGDNVYFERLKDFGVIYYMQMFSGIEQDNYSRRYVMPTLGLTDIDQQTKDKKVKELYPKFEQDLKDNLLDYGRTVKSLKDDEVLVVQVAMTKCAGCAIPSSLEITLKASALKDFNSGKADKAATLSKISTKKGGNQ
ncbi:MAG: hypothetical protein ABJA70_16125 [Chryseolinea sp.]